MANNMHLAALPEAFKQALSAYASGNLEHAGSLCHAILAKNPDEFDALDLLGSVQLRLGRLVDALATYEKALAIKPDSPETLNNRAVALKGLKQFDAALASCDRAIAKQPDFFKALNNRANLLVTINRLEEALAAYDKVIAIAPHHVQALNSRANVQVALRRFDGALASYDGALAIRPNDARTLYHRGNVLSSLERFEEALSSYENALAIEPNFAEAMNNRGNALRALKHFDEALASYDKALTMRPDFVEALDNRGSVLTVLKRFEEALASHDTALSIKPDFVEALNNRGAALAALKRLEEALASCDRALAIKHDYVDALYNRGNALMGLNRFNEALESYDRVLAIRPGHAGACGTRGKALEGLGRLDEALESYDRGISIEPDLASAHFRKSECLLVQGRFESGWSEYEWRWLLEKAADERRVFRQSRWHGAVDLRGKTILIYSEQGFGDTIQFCRFAKLLSCRGVKIIFEVQSELVSLISSLDPSINVIARGDKILPFDYHIPLMSLPLECGTVLNNIPNQVPYLSASKTKIKAWHTRLSKHEKPRIGLVWAGNPRRDLHIDQLDRQRSITFAQVAPLLDVTGCEFYSLQKGDEAIAQLRDNPVGQRVVHWTDELHDFSDTAALLENLDLVITVDTAVAHLAGALGKPFWLINRYNTCWRWLLDREDSPWYPTARIFRQPRQGDWAVVIDRIASELRRWIDSQIRSLTQPTG